MPEGAGGASPVRLASVEMTVHLHVQHPLGERLFQPVQQAVLAGAARGSEPERSRTRTSSGIAGRLRRDMQDLL